MTVLILEYKIFFAQAGGVGGGGDKPGLFFSFSLNFLSQAAP